MTQAFDPVTFVKTLPTRPGVYRMLDDQGQVIYVGKARNLRSRVSSYFRNDVASPKTRAMVARVARVEVTITRTEAEALLLENNLIKEHRPRYNVLLRDDKSYPYIHLSGDHPFPRIGFHRGARRGAGRYFGPYPSAGAVRATLREMQRLFRIRQCEDTFFANRSRPCLQYQIDRCSAPCVGYISSDEYARDVAHAVQFLEGRSNQVIDDLARRMEQAAAAQEYELAARYRDQIIELRRVQEKQFVSGASGDFDVIAAVRAEALYGVAVGTIRGGRQLGTRTYFPRVPDDTEEPELRAAFLAQYYAERKAPSEVLTDGPVEEEETLERMLAEDAGRRVAIRHRLRGERARWVAMARENAEQALAMRMAADAGGATRLAELQEALELEQTPSRIECFDISHTMGEATVASCVVFGPEGAIKSDYRRFNIRDVTPGDDYAAIRQAVRRRYSRLKREEAVLPDLLLIDGGKGQLTQAREALAELQVDEVQLVGVAKGPSRRPGLEQLFLSGRDVPIILPPDSGALQLIQQVRDEAHRFAITGHRQRRARARRTSSLETIPGLGPKRRRELLRQFGGIRQVARADVLELSRVPGISGQLAQRIYDSFHPDEA